MPARSSALSHALKGLCLLLSTFVSVSLAVLVPTPANAAETLTTTKNATTTTLRANYTTVAYASHPTLYISVKRSNGTAANGTVQLYHRPSSTSSWTTGAALTTSSGAARFTYSATRTLTFKAVYKGSATDAVSTSSLVTVTVNTSLGSRAVQEAARHKGAPYQWGADGPTRFDCSGYTRYVFGRFGKSLPHNSAQQYSVVKHISKSSMRIGDLLFFYSSGGIHHVGIYAGNGNMWHEPKSGDVVRLAKIYSSSYYVGRVG